jgi:hypothetical protein
MVAVHVMMVYVEVELQLLAFIALALDGGEGGVSGYFHVPTALPPRKSTG